MMETLMLMQNLENQQRDLTSLKEKNARMEKEVQRLNEREALENRISVLKAKILTFKFEAAVVEYQDSKDSIHAVEQRYREQQEAIAPLTARWENAKHVVAKITEKEKQK